MICKLLSWLIVASFILIVACSKPQYPRLTFNSVTKINSQNCTEKIKFPEKDSPYLSKFRSEFHLDKVIADSCNDFDRVRAISGWVKSKWEHDENTSSEKSDPISILNEAARGRNFRCVEYAIVVAGALNAIGIPTRVLGLMTKDVETRKASAGHVVAEAYLPDMKQWVMIDGQWDVMPTLNKLPIGAVEFAIALQRTPLDIQLISSSSIDPKEYISWITPYLYYFRADTVISYDNNSINNKDIILGPDGSQKPTIFQRTIDMSHCSFTHSIDDFYCF